MSTELEVRAGSLDLPLLRRIYEEPVALRLAAADRERIAAAARMVDKIVTAGDAAYGINTGFGLLAQTVSPMTSSRSCSATCCYHTPRASARRSRMRWCA